MHRPVLGMGNTAANTRKERNFVTLDGLRGLAALCIAVRHAPYVWGNEYYPVGLFHESYLAVDFFFVLSGFVLTFAYQERLASGMRLAEFATVRLVRLYPLYLVSLLLIAPRILGPLVKGGTSHAEAVLSAVFTLAMLPMPFGSAALFPFNVAVWSLFFENLANIIFGVLAKFLHPRMLAAYLLVSGTVLVLAVQLNWLGFGSGNGPMDAGPAWGSFGAGLARVMYSFFAGMLVYQFRKADILRLGVHPGLICLPLLAILLAYPPADVAAAFDLTCTILVFPLIVLIGSYNNPSGFTGKVFEVIGNLSYGIYVLQMPVYGLVSSVYERSGIPKDALSNDLAGASCLVIVVLLAAVTFYAYDHPLRRWLSQKMKARRGASAALRQSSAGAA